jgi:hypothetical protein
MKSEIVKTSYITSDNPGFNEIALNLIGRDAFDKMPTIKCDEVLSIIWSNNHYRLDHWYDRLHFNRSIKYSIKALRATLNRYKSI